METQPRSELTVLRDYFGAVRAVRKARTIFLIVVLLSLLTQVSGYCLARWGPRLERQYQEYREQREFEVSSLRSAAFPEPTTSTSPSTRSLASAASPVPETQTTTEPVAIVARPGEKVIAIKRRLPVASRPASAAIYREDIIRAVLPLARFAGLACSGLLIMTYLIGVNICLAGRMGGVCHATSAFFWSVVLVTLLFPWRNLVPGSMIELPDAFFTLAELQHGLRELPHDRLSHILHYGRFILWPVFAMLAALVSGVRFSLAYRHVQRAVEPLILMKVV
ncbi:MAG: hypothetical protein JXQ73_25465 [Phycisphaerae bacterium]|nr:hypothetical protein [Phycisphaerae bacterium]